MKNNVDYIYEYSDLNFLQTRVQLLTGKYQGMVLEFGESHVFSHDNRNDFTFDYTLYEVPSKYKLNKLLGNLKFEKYLSNLLISIIVDKNKNPEKEKELLDEAVSFYGVQSSKIEIDDSFYPPGKKSKFIKEMTTGTVDF